jgi:hypothetical protein
MTHVSDARLSHILEIEIVSSNPLRYALQSLIRFHPLDWLAIVAGTVVDLSVIGWAVWFFHVHGWL